MLYNSAPLAFLDVDPRDYAKAMLGIYELRDVSIAAELFAWTYRRSIRKYQVILESMGSPDAFRVRHREHLSEAVQRVVREGLTLQKAISNIGVPAEDASAFRAESESTSALNTLVSAPPSAHYCRLRIPAHRDRRIRLIVTDAGGFRIGR